MRRISIWLYRRRAARRPTLKATSLQKSFHAGTEDHSLDRGIHRASRIFANEESGHGSGQSSGPRNAAGDHQLSLSKLAAALGAKDLRPAQSREIVELFGAAAGSLGPVAVKNTRVLSDFALNRRNMVTAQIGTTTI